ncbi:MAG: thiolase family protein [Dehalococcoidia bacterium]|nr:thiolase family protein [Dehalococcoidia bacterium]MDD5493479.1 thiolase family protein [Dehalococcoidia bacterium]
MSRGKLAIVGIGEVATGWYPDRTEWDMIYDTCIEAIRDSGLGKNDVEGVISVNPMAQPKLQGEIGFGKVPEELGLKGCKDICIVNAGGSTTTNALRLAEHWIQSGIAKTVLIHHCTKHSSIPIDEAIRFFATAGIDLQWEYPFGMTYNALIALSMTRYMHDTKTTPEEMASIVVALNKWAQLDPLSMNRKPVTIEKVLASRMVTTPLHAFECNRLGDGASAMVVTSPELAKKLTDTPVYKLGEAVRYTQATITQRTDREGIRKAVSDAAKEVLKEAGITLKDISILELYVAYPLGIVNLLEGLGICMPGEAGKFIMEGNTSPGGKLPVSTMGDAVGRGHTGSGVGTATYVECARQLMGRAGERQVPNCKYILTNSAGGSGMNMIWSVFGRELK